MADKLQMYIEVKDKSGKTITAKMPTAQFSGEVAQSHGLSRNSTIQDCIKEFNTANKDGFTAKLVVEVNGKRIGEGKTLAEQYLMMSLPESSPEEQAMAMEAKNMKQWLEESFEKYNDLMEAFAKINVRDEDIQKEWSKVDKAFDGILKIFKKKYAKA